MGTMGHKARRREVTMTHEDAFLQAIIESPDDTPRLVYADWLEDHRQPERAELIRVQCELEPVRFEIDRPRVQELFDQEGKLLHLHREGWLGPAVVAMGAGWTPSHHPGLYGPF